MLENKVAVIYGAGGAIGSAVARRLCLTGPISCHRAPPGPVEIVAKEVASAGGSAEAAGGRSRRAGCGQPSTGRDRKGGPR
jgi:NAD(P)-dependent dehydrogenase (short-subunit alcohol dehydrogenase family)